jgi:hypothetical protein
VPANYSVSLKQMTESKEEYQARIRQLIADSQQRHKKKSAKPKRKNQKPEKQVEKDCLKWLKENGFSVHIYESKAKSLEGVGYTHRTPLPKGHPDCAGVDPNGLGVYIEFKAPGRLTYSSFSEEQLDFIKDKIEHGAFAIGVDNSLELSIAYSHFGHLRSARLYRESREYLLSRLPKNKTKGRKAPWE